MSTRTLRSGFLQSFSKFPRRPALRVDGKTSTYEELGRRAASLAATLQQAEIEVETPLTAVFAHRSSTAFAGVLGSLLYGHGYVPLNPTFPPDRTANMLERSECRSMIVDVHAQSQLDDILDCCSHRMVIVLPDAPTVSEFAARWPHHAFLGSSDLASADHWQPSPVSEDDIAYLLFTSGSTGLPKGVMVAHRNVTSFCDWAVSRYEINHEDRLSQLFEMTFDLSVFDMFVAWERGACVCCASRADTLTPARYVLEENLTVWFSVPSSALLMKKLRMLEPAAFANLRVSLFCGEALPTEVAQAWAQAAPNSVVENLYGPTELTIACAAYRWDSDSSPKECERGVVPIGWPFAHMEAFVADESLYEVEPGAEGELLMTGPQLTMGYWQAPERTRDAFVQPEGRARTYYRTGDLVKRPSQDGPMVYLGRLDNQVKIHGHRVELGEVEAAIREVAAVDIAIAVGWPVTVSGADAIVAFLADRSADVALIRKQLEARLPSYMVPRRINLLPEFPLNANGKVDRSSLLRSLSEGTSS